MIIIELTAEMERDFFKTLASLKAKVNKNNIVFYYLFFLIFSWALRTDIKLYLIYNPNYSFIIIWLFFRSNTVIDFFVCFIKFFLGVLMVSYKL
mgnify:CR=1 FL=1